MVDVDVMDPGTMTKMLQVDFEDVGDADEDTLRAFDESNDPIMVLNDFHEWHEHCSATVRNDLAYLSKNDILSPLYLCLSTRKRVVELDFRLDNEYNHHPQSSPSSSSFVVVVRVMKKRSSNRRMTAYVQGRHHKKPVHICVSEKNEKERERTRKQRRENVYMRNR